MSTQCSNPSGAFVTVRFFESILDKRNRVTSIEPWGWAAIEYVPRKYRESDRLRIVVNGQALHPDEFETEKVPPGSEVIVYILPAGMIFGPIVGALITIALVGISIGIQLATAPSTDTTDGDLEDSATYGFDAIKNTTRPGTPIPIIYGEHRVGGHIIGQFTRRTRNPPAGYGDPQAGELHTLIGVCSGPVESISDVRVDLNPIADFGGTAEDVVRLGYNHQSHLDEFRDITVAYPKNQELRYNSKVTWTTTDPIDRFEIIVRFPGGLYHVSDEGAYQQHQVDFRVKYREAGTSTWYQGGLSVARTTKSAFDCWYRSPDLKRAKYEIEIERLTVNDGDVKYVSTSTALALNEVTEVALTYPRIAQLAVKQLPTNQVSGNAPTYDCLVRGRIVRVYDTTSTYEDEWSDNPAWCLLDLLTDPFAGLGAWISHDNCDIQSFIDWAAFCNDEVQIDDHGATEKRFRCDIVLDGSLTAIDAIKQICTTGRANFYLRGDKWFVRPEQPEDPVQLFQMSRIHKDSFKVERRARRELANYFVGQFWNRDLDFQEDALPREDPTLNAAEYQREKTINLLGTTRASQAKRLLNFFLLSNRLLRRRIELEVGVDAIAIEAGDVFKVAHDVPGWGYSGKIQSVDVDNAVVYLDREITIEADTDYELTVIHADDTIDVVRVTSLPGTSRKVYTSGDFSVTPLAGIDYAIGEVGQSTVLYRCLSITRGQDPTRRKITAIEYNEAVYENDLTVLPTPSVSRLPDPRRIPAQVTDLRLNERISYAEDGSLYAAIDAHFTLPTEPGVRAQIFWRQVGDYVWESAGPPVSAGYFTIDHDIISPGGHYEVSVVSVSQTGTRRSPELGMQASILTQGTTRQPSSVTGFNVDRTLEGLVFRWDPINPVANFDLDYYEVRNGAEWKTATLMGWTRDTTLRTNHYVSGQQTFLCRARNTAGKYSADDAVITMSVDGRIGENIVLTRSEQTSWTGIKTGFTVDDDDLLLDTTAAVVAWRAFQQSQPLRSSLLPGGFGVKFRVSGSYVSEVFQVGTTALRCLIGTDVEIDQVDQSLYWDSADVAGKTWDSQFARERAWSVAPDDRVSAKIEMRFSTTTSDDSSFGDWQERPQNIEALVKYAQVRLLVVVEDPTWTVRVSKLNVIFDVPEIIESGVVETSAVQAVSVTFDKDFYSEPKLTATIIGTTAGDEIYISNKDADGFDIEVKNSGSRVVRTVNYTAVGY